MVALRLSAVVGKDRQLIIQVPDDIPVGPVEVIVLPAPKVQTDQLSARDTVRAKLLAAGALRTAIEIPAGARRLSLAERLEIGKMPPHARTSEDLIDEDRDDYF